jgi:hypothetical protein
VGKVAYWDTLYVLTKCLGDIIKNNEMGVACSSVGKRKGEYRILVGGPDGRRHLEDQGMCGGRILKRIFKIGVGH